MNTSPVTIWRKQKEETSLIGMKGKVLVWTMIYISAKEFSSQAPYPVVIIQLENKEKMICQMVDWEENDLKKNQKVVLVLRRAYTDNSDGILPYHIKCKPL